MTTAVVMSGKEIPIFNSTNFVHWKLKEKWHIAVSHDEMLTVIREGLIIPEKWVDEFKVEEDKIIFPINFLETPKK